MKIITGHKAEAWTDEQSTVHMPTDLPRQGAMRGRRWSVTEGPDRGSACRSDAFRQRDVAKGGN